MKTNVTRISLIVAIVAGAAMLILQLTQLKQKFTSLQAGLAKQMAAREKSEADLVIATQEAAKISNALKQSVDALAAKNAEAIVQAHKLRN
jgi:hypothetical protein